MALCSYQTLARYDDCSRKYRVRNLDDIRARERETLYTTRFQLKSLKMLQNRRTLVKSVISCDGDEEDDYDCEECSTDCQANQMAEFTPPSYFEADKWSDVDASSSNWAQTFQTESCWSSPAASPAWSSSSASTSNSSSAYHIDGCEVPAYFLETPQASTSRAASSPQHGSCKGGSKRTKHYRDVEKITNDFIAFKEIIKEHCFDDSHTISSLINSNWQAVLSALQSLGESHVIEALTLLTSLISDNLVQPETILHIMQHGLIFGLKDCLINLDSGYYHVVKLVVTIGRSTPAILPYMVDLMANSRFLFEMEKTLASGAREDVGHVIEFYYQISELLIAQIMEPNSVCVPLIPQILILTGVSKQTVNSYSLVSTLAKCLSPNLIKNLVAHCLSRSNQRNEESVTMTLLTLANTLKLTHIRSMSSEEEDTNWTITSLRAFRDSNLDLKLTSLISALNRLIVLSESSEQCSQGVGTANSAAQSKEQCEQFLIFYRQYYDPLIARYSQLL